MIVTQWRPIPGYPRYEASSEGQIRGPKGTPLRPTMVACPTRPATVYAKVGLYVEGKRRWAFVQRLVLLAFRGQPPEGFSDACHRDGEPLNNAISNLAWGDRSSNLRDANSPEGREATAVRLWRAGLLDEADPDVHVEGVPF